MTAQIIPFRPCPPAPEVPPMLAFATPFTTGYLISLAIFGLVAITVLDGLALAGPGKH